MLTAASVILEWFMMGLFILILVAILTLIVFTAWELFTA